MIDRKKILVLMSGGVDSSTAAALLHSQGHDIAGVYLKFWEADRRGHATGGSGMAAELGDPCWALEMKDAARVAAKLGISFSVWDVTEEYKTRVLKNFYSEYAAGRTPNPDILCNSEIKFGIALDRALVAGYGYVATGHYARIHNSPHLPSPGLRPPSPVRGEGRLAQFSSPAGRGEGEGVCELWAAADKNKDQSYFLWRLTQEQLAHVMFPIGEYTKPEVRALAEKFGLHNAEKKDSQGVCFLGKIDLKEFLYGEARPPLTPPSKGGEIAKQFPPLTKGRLGVVRQSGPIVDAHGNFLGFHDGLAHFTIGQRHGTKLGGTGPYFVVEKDAASNTLIVANEEEEVNYRAVECSVRDVNWIGEAPKEDVPLMVRPRYRAPLVSVTINHVVIPAKAGIQQSSGSPIKSGMTEAEVVFDEPARAVAPGQSIVFYEGDKVIGGGVIDEVTLLCKVQKYATVS